MDQQTLIEAQSELLEWSRDALIVSDLDGRIRYWNRGAEEMYGWQSRQVMGRVIHDLLNPLFAEPASFQQAQEALRSAGRWEGRLTQATRSGRRIAIESQRVLRRDARGEPCAVLEINRQDAGHPRSESLLQEGGLGYPVLFNEMPNGVAIHEIICGPDGKPADYRFLAVNPAFERLTGLAAAQVVGRTVLEVLPGTEPAWIERYGRVVLTGEPAQFESYSAALGRHYEVHAFSPEPGKFAVIFNDITERKRTEEALRDGETRLREVLESTLDASYKCNLRSNTYDYLSPVIARITGYTPGELQAMSMEEAMSSLAHPDDVAGISRAIAESMSDAAGAARQVDYRFKHRDGRYRWLRDRFTLVRGADGQPSALIGGVSDITDYKQAEEALRASEARFAAIFYRNPVGIAMTRLADFQFVAVNPAWQKSTGYTQDEVISRTMHDLNMWVYPEERQQFIKTMREQHGVRDFELRLRRKSGEIDVVLLTASLVDIGGERYMLAMATDITERKQMEAALHRSQKTEALATLAAGIAHDFNNLLLVVSGNTRLASEALAPDHPARESLAEITRATARAAALVRQIQAFGRGQDQTRQVLSMQPVVEEALNLLRVTIPQSIRVETRFAPLLPLISCNATRIHQAVVNLVTNAVQAIGDRPGRIALSLDAIDVDPALARRVPNLRTGRYVALTVSDDGPGMDQAVLQRIFEPFFSARPFGQGAGLGLAVVDGIVRSHNGAIAVTSQPGLGATFQLYFPASAASAAPPVVDETQPQVSARGERVLIVDDEDALVFLLSRLLKGLGYTVTGFTDPLRALDAFLAHPDAFDVVVTDLSMPGMNGLNLARAMLAARPEVPIVMTTGYIRAEDREMVMALGIRDLILKPDTADEMGRALDRLFRDLRQRTPA